VPTWGIDAQKPVAVRRGNDIYRPVIASAINSLLFDFLILYSQIVGLQALLKALDARRLVWLLNVLAK